MRIGVEATIVPDGSKSSSPDRLPSWKIQISAPKLAVMDSRLMSTALIGRRTDPNVRKRTMAVTPMTIAMAHGTDCVKLAMKSCERDERPPVRTSSLPSGAGVARTSSTTARPSLESGSAVLNTSSRLTSSRTHWSIHAERPAASGGRSDSGHRDQLLVDRQHPCRPAGRGRSRSR